MPTKRKNKKPANNQKDQKQKKENSNQKLQKSKQDQDVMDINVNGSQEISQNQQQSDEQDSAKILSQYIQKMKNCPYKKQQAIKLFRTKGDKRAYSFKQIQSKIKQSLQQMDQLGFDFRYKWWCIKDPKKDKKKHFYKFSRKIYLRFECPKCLQKNGQRKRWTSILGNFQIRFQIQQLEKFWKNKPEFEEKDVDLTKMKYPKIIKWMLKIYKEYCESCNKGGIPFVFQSQVKACQIQFCRSIYGIMQKIRIPKNQGNRVKTVQVHHHKQQLCEACQKGVCFNISKTQLVQKRDGEC